MNRLSSLDVQHSRFFNTCVFVAGCQSFGPDGVAQQAVGQELPDLSLEGLTGGAEDVKLSDLAGRVTFVHFWGTWCAPCVEEIPHIAQIEKNFADRDDFFMLAISSGTNLHPDVSQLRADTEAFLKKYDLDLPTYVDVNDKTRSSFGKIAGWRGFPATMIIDADGVIRGVWLSYQAGNEAAMEKLVAELLEN